MFIMIANIGLLHEKNCQSSDVDKNVHKDRFERSLILAYFIWSTVNDFEEVLGLDWRGHYVMGIEMIRFPERQRRMLPKFFVLVLLCLWKLAKHLRITN